VVVVDAGDETAAKRASWAKRRAVDEAAEVVTVVAEAEAEVGDDAAEAPSHERRQAPYVPGTYNIARHVHGSERNKAIYHGQSRRATPPEMSREGKWVGIRMQGGPGFALHWSTHCSPVCVRRQCHKCKRYE